MSKTVKYKFRGENTYSVIFDSQGDEKNLEILTKLAKIFNSIDGLLSIKLNKENIFVERSKNENIHEYIKELRIHVDSGVLSHILIFKYDSERKD